MSGYPLICLNFRKIIRYCDLCDLGSGGPLGLACKNLYLTLTLNWSKLGHGNRQTRIFALDSNLAENATKNLYLTLMVRRGYAGRCTGRKSLIIKAFLEKLQNSV